MKLSIAAKQSEYIRKHFPTNLSSKSRRRKIYGVAINDADYITKPKFGDTYLSCPAYSTWCTMLKRCYSSVFHKDNQSYRSTIVCDEWLVFSNFRKWWIKNHIDNYQLDKDIFETNEGSIYSPSTCIYIPQWLNNFNLMRENCRGKHKIGVYWYTRDGNFKAQCNHPKYKNQKHIGYFDCEQDAYLAWLNRKLEIALELKPEMDAIHLKIYPNIVELIKTAT